MSPIYFIISSLNRWTDFRKLKPWMLYHFYLHGTFSFTKVKQSTVKHLILQHNGGALPGQKSWGGMLTVNSAVSGEEIAELPADEFEGKSVRRGVG